MRDRRFKDQEQRMKLLFAGRFDDWSRRSETLEFYRSYLSSHLKFPVLITGIEDFSWEEFYIFGPGDPKEYEELKKSRPSYTDIYSMSKLNTKHSQIQGLFADTRRLSDNKIFHLPLAELKAVDEKSPDHQLLDDYSIWFVNS